LEEGIHVTAKSEKHRKGDIFVDEIIHLSSALESWDVPASSNRVAYILDVTDTPELLGVGRKALKPDGYIKKEVTQYFPGSETVLIAHSVRMLGQVPLAQQPRRVLPRL
jgi:hypothetical protein